MEVPERAVWARTLLAELNRVLNHLMFLGSYPLELGAITPIFYAFREREELQAVMEEVSGGRMHYMFNRVGGLKEDLPAGWLVAGRRGDRGRAPPAAGPREPDRRQRDPPRPHPRRRRADPRRRSRRTASRGPIARACGVDLDLRRDEPYLAYGELFDGSGPGRVVTRTAGDCLARLEVLLEQIHVSLDLAAALRSSGSRALPPGPVNVRLPKVLAVPEGHLYTCDREPARLQRLLPGLARRQDAVAAQAALGVVQQHLGARARCCRAT